MAQFKHYKKRRERQQSSKSLFNQININPYLISFILFVFALILCCIIIYCLGYNSGIKKQYQRSELIIHNLNNKYSQQQTELMQQLSFQEAVSTEDSTSQYNQDAIYIAKLLYGQAQWNSTNAQEAIAWLVINRVESPYYPNTIQEVVEQQSQWMGYSKDNIYTEEMYNIALKVITAWENGDPRPFAQDYLYMTWSESEIILRTSFEETKGTRYLSIS